MSPGDGVMDSGRGCFQSEVRGVCRSSRAWMVAARSPALAGQRTVGQRRRRRGRGRGSKTRDGVGAVVIVVVVVVDGDIGAGVGVVVVVGRETAEQARRKEQLGHWLVAAGTGMRPDAATWDGLALATVGYGTRRR